MKVKEYSRIHPPCIYLFVPPNFNILKVNTTVTNWQWIKGIYPKAKTTSEWLNHHIFLMFSHSQQHKYVMFLNENIHALILNFTLVKYVMFFYRVRKWRHDYNVKAYQLFTDHHIETYKLRAD